MAGTATVTLPAGAYTSLGTGPLFVSPQAAIRVVASAGQPAANTVGHTLGFLTTPFNFALAEQLWGIPLGSNSTIAIVTT